MVDIVVNPVLRRELVERMRNRRTFVVVTVYLAVLAGIVYLVYESQRDISGSSFGPPMATQIASVGRSIFEWLLFFMLLLVLFLVPAQTAGAIAGERERQTLAPLQITLLRPVSLLLGKVGASLAFLLLLLVVTVPLVSVSYLIGGVTVSQVLGSVGIVAFIGVTVACVSASISAFCRRVQIATVLSYGAVLALTLGTLLVYGAAALVDASRGTDEADPPAWLLYPNPFVMVADVVGGESRVVTMSSPFEPIQSWLREQERRGRWPGAGNADALMMDDGMFVEFDEFGDPVVAPRPSRSVWPVSVAMLGGLAAAGVAAGARRLRTPAAVER